MLYAVLSIPKIVRGKLVHPYKIAIYMMKKEELLSKLQTPTTVHIMLLPQSSGHFGASGFESFLDSTFFT